MKEVCTNEAWENLANAIIEQAATDYRHHLDRLKFYLKSIDESVVHKFVDVLNEDYELLPQKSIKRIDEELRVYREYINPMIDDIRVIIKNKKELLARVNNACKFIIKEIEGYTDENDRLKIKKKLNSFKNIPHHIRDNIDKAVYLEKFFTSEYYDTLTSVDGSVIINGINKEINERYK